MLLSYFPILPPRFFAFGVFEGERKHGRCQCKNNLAEQDATSVCMDNEFENASCGSFASEMKQLPSLILQEAKAARKVHEQGDRLEDDSYANWRVVEMFV